MKKLLLGFLLVVSVIAFADKRKINDNIIFSRTSKPAPKPNPFVIDTVKEENNNESAEENNNEFAEGITKVSKDSAMYLHIVKQHGWWRGIGKPLTKEEASHATTYYKLSNKNAKGHWTKIQACDGYGNLTTNHKIATYLIDPNNDYDMAADSLWRERIRTVCQWESIGNSDGSEVVQERAFDASGNAVYFYNPVKISENKYTGCFSDSWGMPIKLRTDSTGAANVVQITRNADGYETLLEFFDEKGFRQKNKDGAYMTKKEYDKDGNQTKEMSCNIVGNLVNDDCGNCGWENEYDERGNTTEYRYYDADWKPTCIIAERGGDGSFGGIATYDKWGRMESLVYLDSLGRQRGTIYGSIHKLVKKYNDRGQCIEECYLDLDGDLTAMEGTDIAQMSFSFNKQGLQTEFECKNKNGNYINAPSNLCKFENKFDDKGNVVEVKNYFVDKDGNLVCSYSEETDKAGNRKSSWPQKDLCRIDSVDEKGNQIYSAFFHLNKDKAERFGYHCIKTVNVYEKGKTKSIDSYLDKDGQPVFPENVNYAIAQSEMDSIDHIITNVQLTSNGIECFQNKYDASMQQLLWQKSINENGVPVRTNTYDILFYKIETDYNFYGQFNAFIAKNEFDEPGYAKNWDGIYHISRFDKEGRQLYFDENGYEIDSMDVFMARCPKVYCIEVTDSAAYSCGILDNDVILGFGDWKCHRDLRTHNDGFYVEAVLQAAKEKKMTVLRHHPEENRSEIVELALPEGTLSQIGFYPHLLYYTDKEKERLVATATGNFAFSTDEKKESKAVVIAIPQKGSASISYAYANGFRDPGFLLFAKKLTTDSKIVPVTSTWAAAVDSIMALPDKVTYRNPETPNDVRTYYVTNDMMDTQTLQGVGMLNIRSMDVPVSDAVYNRIMEASGEWVARNDNPELASGFSWDGMERAGDSLLDEEAFLVRLEGIPASDSTLIIKGSDRWKELAKTYPVIKKTDRLHLAEYEPDEALNVRSLIQQLNPVGFWQVPATDEFDFCIARKEEKKGKSFVKSILITAGHTLFYLTGSLSEKDLEQLYQLINKEE